MRGRREALSAGSSIGASNTAPKHLMPTREKREGREEERKTKWPVE